MTATEKNGAPPGLAEAYPGPLIVSGAGGKVLFANDAAGNLPEGLFANSGRGAAQRLSSWAQAQLNGKRDTLELSSNGVTYRFQIVRKPKEKKVYLFGWNLSGESASQRSLLPEKNPNPVLITNAKCAVLFANAAARRVPDLIDAGREKIGSARLRSAIRQLARAGTHPDLELTLGEQVQLFQLLFDETSGQVRIFGKDITERVKAEGSLRETQALLEAVARNSPTIVCLKDTDGRYLFANRKFEQLHGLKQQDIVGKSAHELFAPEIADPFQVHDREVIASRKSISREQTVSTRRGERTFVEVKFPVTLPGRGVIAIGLIGTDITERKKADNALLTAKEEAASSRLLLLDAFDNMSEGIVIYDKEHRLVLCNRRYREFYRYSDEEAAPGTRFEDLIETDLKKGIISDQVGETHFARRIAQRDQHKGSLEIRLTDGRWLQIRDRKTATGGTVSIQTDITELKSAEQAIAETEARLTDAIENMSEGIVVYDRNDRLMFCNRRYREFYGYSEEDAKPGTAFLQLGKLDAERGVVEHSADANSYRAKRLATRRELTGSADVRLNNGRWLQIRDRRTESGGIVTIQTDITKRKETEAALWENRKILRAVIDQTPAIINLKDADGTFLISNPAQAEFYGKLPGELEGKSIDDIADADYAALTRKRDQQVIDSGEPLLGFEDTSMDSEGNWSTWYTTKVPLHDDDGNLTAILTISHDITHRKLEETAIREAKRMADEEIRRQREEIARSEVRYKAILEDQTELICRLDPDLNLTFANSAFQKTFLADPSKESVIGRSILDFVADGEMRESYALRLRALTPDRPIARSELLEKTAEGGLQWQAWTDRALFDGAGAFLGYQSVGRDITEKKLAEQALAANLSERQAIVDGAIDAIITFDGDGKISEFNPAAEAIFKCAREDVLGCLVSEVIVPEAYRTARGENLTRYMRRTAGAEFVGERVEIESERRDGKRFPAELVVVKVDDLEETAAGGQVRTGTGQPEDFYVAYLRDLTESKQMEEEVSRQRQAVAQTEKMGALGSLLANVAHELNNPLSVVIGQADILRELAANEAIEARAERIKGAASRCAGIVRTFLAAMRQKPPERKAFAAIMPITDTLQLVEYGFSTSGIDLETQIESELPILFGDETQVGQVLTNLLINAQQAVAEKSQPRQVRFVVQRLPGNNQLLYRVSDNGPGIPEEIRTKIFEPFFTTKEEGAGTGIGLAIAHNIVIAHGGTITVGHDAELGGASFELRLPVHDDQDAVVQAAASPGPVGEQRKAEILIVDDEVDVAETAADFLVIAGFNCEVAGGGRQALKVLEGRHFDVILSDIRMPDIDGPALYHEAIERWPGIERRFGFFTGDNLGQAANKFLKENDVSVIEKPFDRGSLSSLVEKILHPD